MKQVLINRLERLEQQTKRSCVGLILPVRNGWVLSSSRTPGKICFSAFVIHSRNNFERLWRSNP